MRRRLVVLVAVLGATAIAVPAAFAQVTPADVAEARDRMRAVTADLEGRVELYDAAVVREVDLRERTSVELRSAGIRPAWKESARRRCEPGFPCGP